MVRVRGILAALVMSSAVMALPVAAQANGSVSLTHTVMVTVPARVKVRVASLAVSAPVASSKIVANKGEGLSLTVSASKAWVVAIGSQSGNGAQTSRQLSSDGRSQFSVIPSAIGGYRSGQPVLLTLSAP
jgi:spore coat protein U-like protein